MAEPQITLYRDVNFGGRSVVLTTCGSSNLGNDYGFNDQTSSIRVQSGIWLVYNDAGYGGSVYVLTPGEYPSPGTWGGSNDSISSVRPLPGVQGSNMAILFQDTNYGSRMVAVTSSIASLGDIDFNDQASSAIVLGGTWLLYKDSNFKGTTWSVSATGGPGHNGYYPSASGFFDNDAISSIKPG
ncbi:MULTISPECIES: beta/gamma crystallin-related protein [unclassified Corallococcus]|uniref:beta/gamma crystallin-related protein n=1 Tax=unclassified Corallococcus TaxID=2685029 RepID=UPI001A907C97|nr:MULTISPECIES: beta/gamma crystallin-related protein [unclassified Corallococcus]MBN9682108.1 beta/gamma crystallin family protein [Corallococcus sp. NCSPR001]WAS86331.1 beta/gamma crystallin-related protein [Corallococcus sp. NCRR]